MSQLTGKVTSGRFAAGSKSDRNAVYLETDAGRYVLRRPGGNPFRDPELDGLVGKTITATGELLGYTFMLGRWTEVQPDQRKT